MNPQFFGYVTLRHFLFQTDFAKTLPKFCDFTFHNFYPLALILANVIPLVYGEQLYNRQMAAHFAKRNTKFGGGGKRGRAKISSPQPPSFLPARAFSLAREA